jgi:uncharacterized protein (TIGR04255 family)
VGTSAELPDFDKPPVHEVIGSVQFPPLPKLGIQEMIEIGNELADYELSQLQPLLAPIQEVAPGQPPGLVLPQFFFNEPAPQRAWYAHREDPRFVVQLQRDRAAVNERRLTAEGDPSSKHVWPQLSRVLGIIQQLLVEGEGYGPQAANLVELTYANVITGVQIDEVLRALSRSYATSADTDVENVSIGFSFPRYTDEQFVGRVYVQAGPALVDGDQVLQMQLVARRLAERGADLAAVYEACHRDAVETFASVTEPDMHKLWERTR